MSISIVLEVVSWLSPPPKKRGRRGLSCRPKPVIRAANDNKQIYIYVYFTIKVILTKILVYLS